ncbi:hypothetical protein PBRA_003111, partial [Plasmodiophora brassicae]
MANEIRAFFGSAAIVVTAAILGVTVLVVVMTAALGADNDDLEETLRRWFARAAQLPCRDDDDYDADALQRYVDDVHDWRRRVEPDLSGDRIDLVRRQVGILFVLLRSKGLGQVEIRAARRLADASVDASAIYDGL